MKAKDLKKGQRYKVPGWKNHPFMKDWVFEHIRIDKAGNVFGKLENTIYPVVDPETEVELIKAKS